MDTIKILEKKLNECQKIINNIEKSPTITQDDGLEIYTSEDNYVILNYHKDLNELDMRELAKIKCQDDLIKFNEIKEYYETSSSVFYYGNKAIRLAKTALWLVL